MTRLTRRLCAVLLAAAVCALAGCDTPDNAGHPRAAPAGASSGPDDPLPAGARPQRLADGFGLAEGPIWLDGRLLVSDVEGDTVYDVSAGRRTPIQRPSGYANGHALDRQGRLVQTEHGNRRVARRVGDTWQVVADHYQGRRLNSPNDVVTAADGSVLFTDPTFGLQPPYGPPGARAELDFAGVYRVAAAGGEPRLLTRDLGQPNGIGLSPDGSTLYVSDTGDGQITAFAITADALGPGRRFAPGVDGLAVDHDGRVWAAVDGGIAVYDPTGQLRQTIGLPDQPTNLAWGGPDGTTLYITTYTAVYQLPTRTTAAEAAR